MTGQDCDITHPLGVTDHHNMRNSGKTLSPAPLQVTCVLGHLANDWAATAIWLLAPAIGLAFDLKPSQVGLLLTINSIGASLAYFPAGILADRVHNQGRLLLATFWWVTVGYLLASLAPGFWSLALLLAIAGMGDAAWHPIATGILVRQMPRQKGQALGIHAVGGSLAEMFSPLLVGFLLAVLNWQTVLQIAVVPAALMGIVFVALANKIPQRHASSAISRADLVAFVRQWRTRAGLRLVSSIGAYNMALIALMTMTPLFAQRVLGFSPAQAGMAFAAAMLVGSVGQPLIGRLSDRSSRVGVFVFGLATAAALIGAALLTAVPLVTLGLLTGAMGVLVAIRSGILVMAIDHASEREATALGFIFVLLDGVGALGAVLAGLVGDFDLRFSFLLAAGLSLASVAVITLVKGRQ
ncbi:MAG: MFS transporter [Arenicellales bacterium]|nr:MFS transporter [Arenicellales bacterium]MDP7120509.1 MFS transporter [Arenicellales bacterium]